MNIINPFIESVYKTESIKATERITRISIVKFNVKRL